MKPIPFVAALLLVAASASAGAQRQAASSHPAAPPAGKSAAPVNAKPQARAGKSAVPLRPKLHVPAGDTAAPPVIMREIFTYSAAGRRDPFYSLLNTSELRPALSDLTLAGILQDNSGHGQSVAILKDAKSTQYRVRVGSTLGRMRVAAIHRNSVVFLIEEFGASRQDSLVLSDSTTTRSQ